MNEAEVSAKPTITPINHLQRQTDTIKEAVLAEKASPLAASEESPLKQETISPKFAALARREKMLREQARKQAEEFKAREEAWKRQESELSQKYLARDKIKSDPIGTLLSEGISFDDITQAILQQPSAETREVKALQQKLQEIEQKQLETAKQMEEQKTAQYQQALKRIRGEVDLLVHGNDSFELIQDKGAQGKVVTLIEDVFNGKYADKGIPAETYLTAEEAAEIIEEDLVDDYLRGAKLKKIQSKLNPPAPQIEAPTKETKEPMRTLTNSNSSASKPLSARERALRVFHGESL